MDFLYWWWVQQGRSVATISLKNTKLLAKYLHMCRQTILFLLKLFFFSLISCSFSKAQVQKTKIHIEKLDALPSQKGQLMAGSAIFDITPPP